MAADRGGPDTEFAPAKVNLFLHVRGRRADGYHLLESLVVFPQVGDRLAFSPGGPLALCLDGPFAAALDAGDDNLVLKAATAMGLQTGQLWLEKLLPVASGIGGGSSDAAAALRLASRVTGTPLPADRGLSLGADVPVCLGARTQSMAGIGEQLAPGPAHPGFWIVLVNPGVAVPTSSVFRRLAECENPPGPEVPAQGFTDFRQMLTWLKGQRNDLEAPAANLRPEIRQVLEALTTAPFARMSGSGATCFALFEHEAAARTFADDLAGNTTGWWVAAAPVAANPG